MHQISSRCRDARQKSGLSVRSLVEILGCSPATIKKLESSDGSVPDVSLEFIFRYSLAVREPLQHLLFGNAYSSVALDSLSKLKAKLDKEFSTTLEELTTNTPPNQKL